MVEVGGQVDVPPEARLAHDPQREAEPTRLGAVPAERTRSVAELESCSGRHARHVGAVVTAVGDQRHPVVPGWPREVGGHGKVGVGDDDAFDVECGERDDAVLDRSVEPAPRSPEDLCAEAACPCCDLVVVADHEHRQWARRGDDTIGHSASERGPLIGIERGSQAHLRVAEALHGHEHGGAHRGESMVPRMPNRRVVGVLGRPGRVEVDEHGAVWSTDGAWRLEWMVADVTGSWRDPSLDTSVRHQAIDGTPVFETAMRVTGGDVRQRVYAIVDPEGLAIVEVENDSPQPVAVAFSMEGRGPSVVSARPAPAVAVPDGAPGDAVVFPIPHQAVVRVAVPLLERAAAWPARVPTAAQVSAGWRQLAERGERLEAPGGLARRFSLARAQLLLSESVEPDALLLATGARWRLARQTVDMPVEVIARAAQRVADRARSAPGPLAYGALVEAQLLLDAVGEHRASVDVGRVLDRLPEQPFDVAVDDDLELVVAARSFLASAVGARERSVELLREWPAEWVGASVAAHQIPTRWGEVSFAVRWHGERPALLWECEAAVTLCAPSLDAAWQSGDQRGEALLSGVSAT